MDATIDLQDPGGRNILGTIRSPDVPSLPVLPFRALCQGALNHVDEFLAKIWLAYDSQQVIPAQPLWAVLSKIAGRKDHPDIGIEVQEPPQDCIRRQTRKVEINDGEVDLLW
jgi:hypothetical protein